VIWPLFGEGAGGVELRRFGDELGGDPQSIHEDGGLTLVYASFAESGDDRLHRVLNARSALNRGELQTPMGVLGGVEGLVELLVVVAVRHAAERDRLAAPARRHGVMTSFEHMVSWRGYPSPPGSGLNGLLSVDEPHSLVAGH